MFEALDDGAVLDAFDEGVAGAIVGDGEAEGVLRLVDLHLLGATCGKALSQRSLKGSRGFTVKCEK